MDLRAAERLQSVNDFDSLLPYLRDELDWPVEDYGFDDLTFQYTAQELGLDDQSAAKVTAIRRLRPLDDEQPWGIFFLELEPKRLPVVALRRVLSKMTLKKRASSNRSDSLAWHADDILFISRTGESDERHLTFAHFAANPEKADLPVLKVLGWDASDTMLRVDHVAEVLKEKLIWPEDPTDSEKWRKDWREAFTQRHGARVSTAKEMASELAQLARRIRGAIREVLAVESDNGPLTKIMDAFRESLVHDLDAEQFADTCAQTITYGLLSARITDPSKNTLDDLASHMQTNPFLKELMELFIHVGGRKKNNRGVGLDFDELGVSEVVELLDRAKMTEVVLDFGRRNQQEDPVIHFFEGFLQEYDKSIRKDRGVFYTPRPVVSFIVRSVDELLRTEFGLDDGLADTTTWGEMAGRIDDLEIPEGATADRNFVQILDPATGTGTFLVEVIDLIHKTMTAKWQAEGHGRKKIEKLWNAYVPEHLLPRLHGYELMMAPYAIAHMKIGLKLYETGYRFESDERARVYLTNALEPAQDFSGTLDFAIPALAHEAEAVNAIKRDPRFTVVMGNPPYSNFGQQNKNEFILGLLEDYKCGLDEKKINLNDDFIKFVRFSQRLLDVNQTGVLGMITNNVFIDGITHRRMRESLKASFDDVRVLDLHGSSKKLEETPDGDKDENVFDIQQGVGISFFINTGSKRLGSVRHSELWGTRASKYAALARSVATSTRWQDVLSDPPHHFFVPKDFSLADEYLSAPALTEVFPKQNAGIQTKNDGFVYAMDRAAIEERIANLKAEPVGQIAQRYNLSLEGHWDICAAKEDIGRSNGTFVQVLNKPFDKRWTYYTAKTSGFMARPRAPVMRAGLIPNKILLTVRNPRRGNTDSFFVASTIVDKDAVSPFDNATIFPLFLPNPDDSQALLLEQNQLNLGQGFLACLRSKLRLRTSEYGLPAGLTPEDIFHYAYAVFHSPSYRNRYVEFLKIDFPRLPLTWKLELFNELARLGGELVSMHLMEAPKLSDRTGQLEGTGEFRVEAASYSNGTVWIDKAKTRGFKDVPEDVWNFHIGGYQVCEKWLKDRQAKGGKNPRPGRVLTDEDIEHYQKIVVALSETIRIMAEIDEVIEAHGGWPGAFHTGDAGDEAVSDVVYAEADDGASQLDMVGEPKDG